ncbi:polysaccharide biosynthesis C-terminal domain-containing protein, partial [Bacillus altitudinis]|uniref:polysaccharide biosynthesis C-terminal domain-containing protein n=1 Tax=Bacillus altitudinis TaxID=293387 RepID=UPI00307D24AA
MPTSIFFSYPPLPLLFSLFTINPPILQPINKQKFPIVTLFLPIIIKTLLNIPLITSLQANHSLLPTPLPYTASIFYIFIMINPHARYSFRRIFKRFILIPI